MAFRIDWESRFVAIDPDPVFPHKGRNSDNSRLSIGPENQAESSMRV
jgi:hypothetical protein